MRSDLQIDDIRLVRAAQLCEPVVSGKTTRRERIEAELRDAAFLCWIFALLDLTIMYVGLAWLNVTKAGENRKCSKVALLTYTPLPAKMTRNAAT